MRKILTLLMVLLLGVFAASAQSRTITGKVINQSGEVIPFATVTIKGTTTGVSSNSDGVFTISAKTGDVLVITSVSTDPVEVTLTNESNITVKVGVTASNLKEVVVTALGFQSQRDRLTTSQSTVKADAIEKSGESNVLNALSSKASGLQVIRSGGEPGASAFIQIRGQSTITNDLQPLFVIDGIPVSNSTLGSGTGNGGEPVQQSRLGDINPDDIASVEVLKGAAAAALYGTRAANGVILITTKKGKNSGGKVNISLNSTYSIDALNKSVPLQTTFGQGTGDVYGYGNRLSWGDKISNRTGGADSVNTSGAYVMFPDGTKRYRVPNGTATNPHGGKRDQTIYNHGKDLFHNGTYWDNNLVISGGDDKTIYYASIENFDQQGILKENSAYHRKSVNLNVERRFGTVLKIATNIGYSNVKANRAQQGSNTSGLFLGGLRTPADFNNEQYAGTYVDADGALFPNRQVAYRNPIGASTNSIYDNPFWSLHNITSTTEVNRTFGSFEATVNPLPWLSFISRSGVDFYSDNRTDNYPVLSSLFQGGSLTKQELSELQFNTDLIGRVSKDFTQNFSFTGLVGFNYNNRTYENVGATARNFILPDAPFDLNNSAASARFPFNANTLIRTTAAYSQLSFTGYNQLFLDLTGRGEQSSTFANTFYYPSVAFGWQFTKLKSFENSKFLSYGKLRATYGEVGVQPEPYLTQTYYLAATTAESYGPTLDASSDTYGGGYLRNTLKGNPDIKPERKKEYELGLDLRFLSNRISLSGTYYQNKTTGAIFGVQVPATTGFTTQNSNAATLQNKGWEADMGINWLRKSDFTFTTNVNWSRNRNKVLSLVGTKSFFLNGFTGVSSRAVEGQPLGVFWGVDFDRDSKGALILDGNGFPTAAPSESVLGDPNPDWIGSITNTLTFKNFSFSFLFDHVQGGQVWNGTKAALSTIGTAAFTGTEATATSNIITNDGQTIASGTTFRGSIRDFGAGPVALTESWYAGNGGGFGTTTDPIYFEDGTRTRLRQVSVGYTITGPNFKKKTKFQSVDISLSGRNLVLWTHYSGIDPETNLTGPSNGRGLDYFNNPSTRSYLMSVKINF